MPMQVPIFPCPIMRKAAANSHRWRPDTSRPKDDEASTLAVSRECRSETLATISDPREIGV
jgi:hypothetical protein